MEGNHGKHPDQIPQQATCRYEGTCRLRPITPCYRDSAAANTKQTNQHQGYGMQRSDPFSPKSLIPLPSKFGPNAEPESPCFRRRNERERERVRCVNDGYIRLKEHLPIANKDKRLSKVDTLRYAVQYIKDLQRLLDRDQHGCHDNAENDVDNRRYGFENSHDTECTAANTTKRPYLKQDTPWSSTIYSEYKSDPDSDYDVLNYSSDFTDMSSDIENLQ